MPARFRLAEILAQRGMTQSELARKAGVSFPTVNRMCSNQAVQVTLAVLDKLAAALGVEPGDLIVRGKKKR